MRIPSRRRGSGLGFNLTAMIDVVFNLIVFFLVASHFSHSQSDASPVQLPTATQAGDGDDDPHRVTITVTRDGKWRIAQQSVSLADIERSIREGADKSPGAFSVHIRGDRSAKYQFIEPLLLAAAKASVTSVQFNVLAK